MHTCLLGDNDTCITFEEARRQILEGVQKEIEAPQPDEKDSTAIIRAETQFKEVKDAKSSKITKLKQSSSVIEYQPAPIPQLVLKRMVSQLLCLNGVVVVYTCVCVSFQFH